MFGLAYGSLCKTEEIAKPGKILRDSRKKPKQRQNNKSDAILRAMAAEKGVII